MGDARFVERKSKNVLAVEMSCSWIQNWEKKSEEKTAKYGPLRFELKKQYTGYHIEQCNIIIDVLGVWVKGSRPNNEEGRWQPGI